MLNNQNPEQTLPSPQFYDRSLKTMDIKGAYPNKPWTRQEVFDNRSLYTNDIKGNTPNTKLQSIQPVSLVQLQTGIKAIKRQCNSNGAQPKVNIRSLNQPHYDPSFRIEGFQNTNFSRTPDINSGIQLGQRVPSNRGNSQSRGGQGYFGPSQSNGDLRQSVPAPLSQSYQQPQMYQSQSQYGLKAPYQVIQGSDMSKNSFYNGPTADRSHKPYNQPPSQIIQDSILTSPSYLQRQPEQIRGNAPQSMVIPKSPQGNLGSIYPPQSYLARPVSNPNIATQQQVQQQQISSPIYAQPQGYLGNGNNNQSQSGITNNYRQLEQQQQKFQKSMRPVSNQNLQADGIVEDFRHSALIRPNHYDSQANYQEFKQNIESRIVSPKHYDIPNKMVNYQRQKDGMFSYQQPKLKINRDKLERQYMTKSAMNRNQFAASTPSLIKENFAYQPTPTQQLYQGSANDYSSVIKPQPLIQPQALSSTIQPDQIRRIPTTQSRPKTNPQTENKFNSSLALQSQISPKHSLIEKNVFLKPSSAGPQNQKLSYIKPYTVVPKVDNATEYNTKYNQSTIEQLQKSITPAPRAENSKVYWDNKQQDYNMIGNFVQDKRLYNKTDPYGRQVDKYFKGYDGGQILNMRKDINENGIEIPYEVKFKYEKTKDNYYTVDSAPRVKDLASSYLNPKTKSFAAGKSDIFKVQNYSIRDPVNANNFHYAEKQGKRSAGNFLY